MATAITNYQCPACTGPLHFAPETGKLQCEYCESSFTPEEMQALYEEKQTQAEEQFEEQPQWTDENLRQMTCPSCGAELIIDQHTAATGCPYCGNPGVVPGQFAGMRKPDLIIPFAQTREQAVDALKKHYKGRFLLPRAFKNEHHIEEIQGVYVPFWFFDGKAEAKVHFKCTRSRSYISGDYRVTVTDHYDVFRAGSMTFHQVPVDASTKMPDRHMDAIEPFCFEDMKPFSTAYLPGFMASKYDVSLEESVPRAEKRCCESVADALRETVHGYGSCIATNTTGKLTCTHTQYGLLPVWMLYTKWKNKDFLFAMNGQTGKIVGDLPVSWLKLSGVFVALSAALTGIISLFL